MAAYGVVTGIVVLAIAIAVMLVLGSAASRSVRLHRSEAPTDEAGDLGHFG